MRVSSTPRAVHCPPRAFRTSSGPADKALSTLTFSPPPGLLCTLPHSGPALGPRSPPASGPLHEVLPPPPPPQRGASRQLLSCHRDVAVFLSAFTLSVFSPQTCSASARPARPPRWWCPGHRGYAPRPAIWPRAVWALRLVLLVQWAATARLQPPQCRAARAAIG